MAGGVRVNIPTRGDETFPIQFDRPVYIDAYLKLDLNMKSTGIFDPDYVREQIVGRYETQVGKGIYAGEITALVLSLNPDFYVTGLQLSVDEESWLEYLYPASRQDKYLLDISRIAIN